jgi:hypothetical protein
MNDVPLAGAAEGARIGTLGAPAVQALFVAWAWWYA